jgi:hypothetical protein
MTDRQKLEEETRYAVDLPGFKRTNPHYFRDPMIDRLLEAVLLMGAEIWTLKHRLAVTESLTAAGQVATPDRIETFVADGKFKDGLERERQDLIKRMFSGLVNGQVADPRAPSFKWVTNPGDAKK